MDQVVYDFGYMFTYSERPGTPAEKKYKDDIEESIKQRRLSEIIVKQRLHSGIKNNLLIGTIQQVLVEGDSKKSDLHHYGKCDSGKVVVFKKVKEQKGEYVNVKITHCTTGTLIGEIES
jgi:tRNA-2-methylthio-N6-dimethylallyladenosine synthase